MRKAPNHRGLTRQLLNDETETQMINDEHTNTATITPRLALDPACRFRWQISLTDLERINALDKGDTCEITELEHGTRWMIRLAACSLTEPGVPSCYCDAQALPVEYPGGYARIPNEIEAPAPLRLEALRELLTSDAIHPAYRLGIEDAAAELEAMIELEDATSRALAELEDVETRLDDRNLTATDRAVLEDTRRNLLTFLRETSEDVCGCCPVGDDDSLTDAISILVEAARTVANTSPEAFRVPLGYRSRNAEHLDPDTDALEELLEIVEYACDYCLASALVHLASRTD